MHSLRLFRDVLRADAVRDVVAAHLHRGGAIANPLQRRCHRRPAARPTASRRASAFGGA